MPEIQIAPVQLQDADALLAFEVENRAFFESHINARPAAYYSADGVAAAIQNAIRESSEDKSYQYLMRSPDGNLLGRVNFTNVKRAHFHSAELGYRVAQHACGRGVASGAVRLAIRQAFQQLKLVRLEATARPENLASIRVLENNGFRQFGRSSRSFELHGVWYDLIHFECHESNSHGTAHL